MKKYLLLVYTDRSNLDEVVALAPAGNQIKFDWAGKLELGLG